MYVDITVKVSPRTLQDAQGNEKKALVGHLGTHFDVMDKEFPLENIRRDGLVFDVSAVRDRDISVGDIDTEKIKAGDFVIFRTGFLEESRYGTSEYFKNHPQLSQELICLLTEKQVSMIGIDCAGIRRGAEHTPADQRCANRGIFVIENLCSLDSVLRGASCAACTVHTYPVNFTGMTGLPCRVVAEI